MTRRELADQIDAGACLSVIEWQERTGIPAAELMDAALRGDIARYLGERGEMHILGSDLADLLAQRRPWPSEPARPAADTVRCRMNRLKTPMSEGQLSRDRARREQAALDAAAAGAHADERKDGAAGCDGPAAPDQNPNLPGGRVMAAKHATAGARAPQTTSEDSADVRFLPLDAIALSQDNPRQTFDADGIADLSASLQAVGLLQPIVCRPIDGERFELVCGERRYRAASLLGWSDIRATVRELTDTEAAELRLLENLDREDLNPIEEAVALRQLRDLGHDVASLANLVRRSEADVELREALLDLPGEWPGLIARGDLSAAAGEYLVPWTSHPDVLQAMERHVDKWPMPLTEWKRRLLEIVRLMSRSMESDDPDGPLFEPDDEIAERLDIVNVQVTPGRVERRAMNVSLWDQAQDLAEASADAPAPTAAAAIAGDDDDAPADDPADDPGQTLIDEPEAAAGELFDAAYWDRLSAHKRDWLQAIIVRKLATCSIDELEGFCELLNLQPAQEWTLTRDFLRLHSLAQLYALADEWGVSLEDAETPDEARAILLHLQPAAMPANLLAVDERLQPAASTPAA